MKTSTTIALGAPLLGLPAAYAQTEQPTPYHHYQVHPRHGLHHHHFGAHNSAPAPAPTAQRPGGAVETVPPPPTIQMFKPYPHPGDGDDDGLSRDPDDCMKGCIGGNPG